MVRRRPGRSPIRRLFLASPWLKVLVLVLLGVAAVCRPGRQTPPPADLAEGLHRVQRAVDGDTLLLANGARVRLQGVDTPETKHPHKPPQPFGAEAAAYTAGMVTGREVRLLFDTHRLDRYGRFLAYVYVGDVFLNETLVRRGLARACPQYRFRADIKRRLLAAQRLARKERLGIWSAGGGSQQQLNQTQ